MPGSRRLAVVYQRSDGAQEIAAPYFTCAERGEVVSVHLTVDQRECPRAQFGHKCRKCDFRRIRCAHEHRFTIKHATDGHPVQTADQLPLQPCLETMGM